MSWRSYTVRRRERRERREIRTIVEANSAGLLNGTAYAAVLRSKKLLFNSFQVFVMRKYGSKSWTVALGLNTLVEGLVYYPVWRR